MKPSRWLVPHALTVHPGIPGQPRRKMKPSRWLVPPAASGRRPSTREPSRWLVPCDALWNVSDVASYLSKDEALSLACSTVRLFIE